MFGTRVRVSHNSLAGVAFPCYCFGYVLIFFCSSLRTGNFFVFLFFTTMLFFQSVVPRMQCGGIFLFVVFLFCICSLSATFFVPWRSMARSIYIFGCDPSALCWQTRWPFCPQWKHFPSFMYFSRSESVSLAPSSLMASSSWFSQFPDAVSEQTPSLPRKNRLAWKQMVSAQSANSFAVCKSFGRCSSTCNFNSIWRPEM
jgi:hypothetical protein